MTESNRFYHDDMEPLDKGDQFFVELCNLIDSHAEDKDDRLRLLCALEDFHNEWMENWGVSMTLWPYPEDDNMTNSYEKEYNTEPEAITDSVSIAPTMAGGIALLVDGEHVDHFDEVEMEELEVAFAEALNTLEHQGHCTASDRKFERYYNELMTKYVELGYFLQRIMADHEAGDYTIHQEDSVNQLLKDMEYDVEMLEMMANQLEKR